MYQGLTMHIDHINISAPSELLRNDKDFYAGLLDLKEEFRPNFSSGGYWLYSKDRAIIHLSEDADRKGHAETGYFDHFALRTSDLPGVLGKLKIFDIPYRYIHRADIGLNQVFFKDPAGTGVEINAFGPLLDQDQ